MRLELKEIEEKDLAYTKPKIEFLGYEKMKKQALGIAKFVENILVTEDTIKDAKKILAESRKVTKGLDRKRIDLKNELLEPYDIIASQFNEIKEIIDKANDELNKKVRELDELEREQKREELNNLWTDKIQVFPYKDYIKFEDFLKPQHLNKSQSISKTEEEMSSYLDRTEKDLNLLLDKEDSERYIKRYLENFDLTETLTSVENDKKIEEEIKKNAKKDEIGIEVEKEEQAYFLITGKANIKLVEMLLDENEIDYKKENM